MSADFNCEFSDQHQKFNHEILSNFFVKFLKSSGVHGSFRILPLLEINTIMVGPSEFQFERFENARNVSFFYSLRWLIYVFNPVVNTKLPDMKNTV